MDARGHVYPQFPFPAPAVGPAALAGGIAFRRLRVRFGVLPFEFF